MIPVSTAANTAMPTRARRKPGRIINSTILLLRCCWGIYGRQMRCGRGRRKVFWRKTASAVSSGWNSETEKAGTSRCSAGDPALFFLRVASVYKGQHAPNRVISVIFCVILNRRTSSTPLSSALKNRRNSCGWSL